MRSRRTHTPSHRFAIVVSIAIALVATAAPAGAAPDVTGPPTPTGVTATSNGGGGGGDAAGFGFDAEAGSMDGISSHVNAGLTAGAARNGSAGLRVSSTSAPGYVRWGSDAIEANNAHASVRFWVRVASWGAGESVDLFTLANTQSSRNFDFFVTGDTGRFKWDIFRSSAGESSFAVEPGRWYLVEARISFAGTSHTAEVRIDGVNQGVITSPGFDTNVASTTLGAYRSKTHTQDYDDIVVELGDGPLGWIDPAAGGDGDDNGDATIDLRWDPVVDDESGLREYQVWRNSRWYGWVPAGTTAFNDPAPVPGASYQIRAIDLAGNRSGWSAPATVTDAGPDLTPPTSPSGVSVQPGVPGQAVLSWNPSTDAGGSGLREYAIFRDGRWYDWVPADTTTFVDIAAVPGAQYRVRAYDNALNRSPYSALVAL